MLSPRHFGERELLTLIEKLGIDPGVMVAPRTELSFAIARRMCGKCAAKERCRQVLCRSDGILGSIAAFCPNTEAFVDWLSRQSIGAAERSKAPPDAQCCRFTDQIGGAPGVRLDLDQC
jgi:hypothetical protein